MNIEKTYQRELGFFQNHIPLIGVYGVTSVGKSTFLNALLKDDELKVGLGETTKQLHVIKYFETQEHIDFKGVLLPIEYTFKKLPLLKHFSIVDVPGSNKSFSDEDLELITKKLDVIIWVFDIHGDISYRDIVFLRNVILKNMVKTVVILNKIDSGMDNIDFYDNSEKKDFIEDIRNRQESIVNLFKKEQAEELLVMVLPMSAKKLLSGVTKRKKKKFDQQHEIIEETLISVSKQAFIQKKIFREAYNEVKNKVVDEINFHEMELLKEKTKCLKNKLEAISHQNIIDNNFNQEKLFDKKLIDFSIECKYKNDLQKINNKIKENI